jgi:catalase (peroxidase I)
MLTTDLALAYGDAEYRMLSREYAANLNSLTADFGTAWYQLMSRDHGNRQRCLGDELPPIQPCKSFFLNRCCRMQFNETTILITRIHFLLHDTLNYLSL